jgi:hypothetical protein
VDNMGGQENGGVGGKKGYIYSSSGNFLAQLVSYVGNKHKTAQDSSYRTTRHLMNNKPREKI